MKLFKEYLAESERTYSYRVKIVGDVDSGWLKQLEEKCQQFDVVSFSKPKTTPVQLAPADFPKHAKDICYSMMALCDHHS